MGRLIRFVAFVLALSLTTSLNGAFADVRSDLGIASLYAKAQKQKREQQAARLRVESATILPEQSRYKVGDQWALVVALLPADNARTDAVSRSLDYTSFHATVFHFSVSAVQADRSILAVTRDDSRDTAQVVLDNKRHVLSSSGFSGSVGLDLFPIAIPAYDEGSGQEVSRMPPLPEGMVQAAGSYSVPGPGLSQATQYDSTDLFGRKTQVILRAGDPWPLYMNTPAGTAVLLK